MKQRILEVSAHDPYAYTRFEIWENSLHRIADHPWGVGLGMYKYSSFQYRFPIDNTIVRYGKRAESAHNEYLQMAVELGVGGLVLFLFGIGVWGWEAKKALAGALPRWDKGAVVGLCGGVLAIFVHAIVDSVFHEPALVLLLILSGSLVLVLKRLNESKPVPTWSIPFPYHPARVTGALILVVSLAFLSIQPAAAWFAFEQGSRALQRGDSMRAREWYQRAILIDPGTTAYRDVVALAEVRQFHESGDPRWLIQAVEGIKLSMVLNPLDGRLPYRLGTVYLLLAERAASDEQRIDLVARAAASYAEAINVDPFSPFNYVELGKIRWQQGYVEEAQALLTQAVLYEPNFLPAKVVLAKLAMEAGQTGFARSQYKMIREIRERYRGRTLTLLEKEYVDVSLDSLDQAMTQ
jgi:tetratricopeptide (TPR) repeat protein